MFVIDLQQLEGRTGAIALELCPLHIGVIDNGARATGGRKP